MDYEQIRKSEDRSWSLKLVEKLKTCTEESELDEIVRTLQVLDDYRTEMPLQEIMEDRNNSSALRSLASDVLYNCVTTDTKALRNSWWNSGDEILMRHALRVATKSEKELVVKIANDPEHVHYIDAIEAMNFGFEEPYFQKLKIRAMSHNDPQVRRAAAEAVFWDQPIAAESGLLILANDEDDNVTEKALDALCYYSSQAVLIRLDELIKTARDPLKEMQEKALSEVTLSFATSIKYLKANSPEAFLIFKNWLRPVEHLFNWAEIDRPEEPTTLQSSLEKPMKATVQKITERFNNANGKWADRWNYVRSLDYEAFTNGDKSILETFFSSHIDWSVREQAGYVLAKLDDSKGLSKLLDDSIFCVRRSAAYWIREVSKNEEIAEKLWEITQSEETWGTYGSELLESYALHESSSVKLEKRLVELALTDPRETIRMTAICEMEKRTARACVESVLCLLKEEPLVTWSVHTSILNACSALDINVPGIEKLSQIDDLYVQEYLAKVVCKRRK